MGDLICFKCGQPGHPRAKCPERTVPAGGQQPGPDAPEGAPGKRGISNPPPVPPRRPAAEIAADPHGHADRIRAALGWRHSCGDPADLYDSPFRRDSGLHPIHQCELRQIAAAQITERKPA